MNSIYRQITEKGKSLSSSVNKVKIWDLLAASILLVVPFFNSTSAMVQSKTKANYISETLNNQEVKEGSQAKQVNELGEQYKYLIYFSEHSAIRSSNNFEDNFLIYQWTSKLDSYIKTERNFTYLNLQTLENYYKDNPQASGTTSYFKFNFWNGKEVITLGRNSMDYRKSYIILSNDRRKIVGYHAEGSVRNSNMLSRLWYYNQYQNINPLFFLYPYVNNPNQHAEGNFVLNIGNVPGIMAKSNSHNEWNFYYLTAPPCNPFCEKSLISQTYKSGRVVLQELP